MQAQRGGLTVARNLGEIASQAELILRGRVLRANVEPHPNLPHITTIVVTLRVDDVIKGQAESTFTFRQFVWDVRDRVDAAGYAKGQEYLLFLNPRTRFGLSSPVALEQGRFRIVHDTQGRAYAVNGHGNAHLFRGLAELSQARGVPLTREARTLIEQAPQGPILLEPLRDLIRRLVVSK